MKPIYGVAFVAILAFLFFDMPALRAQAPCYVRLEDASGYEPTAAQLAELEAAAANLCAAFDSAGFGGQFKVYDFGFYLHHEATEGGYPESFARKTQAVQDSSPYYLLFGKETDKSGVYTRFWVDLKLPDTGIFECIDLASLGLRASVEAKLGLLSNAIHEGHGYSPFAYHLGEIAAIDTLIQFVADNATCCDPGSRPTNICETCKLSEDDLVSLLLLNQFDVDSCTISSSTGNDNTSLSSHVVGRTNLVIEDESQSHDFDEQLADWIDEYAGANPGTSVVVYVATYSKNCSDFLYLWEQYQANTSNSKAFFCIIGSIGHRGAVYSHKQFSGIAAKPAHEMRPTYEDGDGEDDTFMAFCKNTPLCGQVLPGPSVLASICFEMEYAILRKLPSHQGRFKFFVWTEAHWNVCSNSVHTILDLCGIILDLCDPVNAAVYYLEGDKKNAALSVASTLPVSGIGTTGAKYAIKIAHTSPATNRVYKLWVKDNVDGTLEFSYGRQLRKVLGMAPDLNKEAHHIIPYTLCAYDKYIYKAIKEAEFHPNLFINGKVVEKNRQSGKAFHTKHTAYHNYVKSKIKIFVSVDPKNHDNGKKIREFIEDTLIPDLKSKIDEAWGDIQERSLNDYFKAKGWN